MRSASPADTERIAAELAASLSPGDVVLVRGELGAGKTTFVRGACRALGVTDPVASPTFTLGRRYRGRVPVSHLDLYRLDALEGGDESLLEDYLTPDAIAFVEWPEVAGGGLEARAAAVVRLAHAGGDEREVEVELAPARAARAARAAES